MNKVQPIVVESRFDAADAFGFIGTACLVGGVAIWSRPAALIVLGLVFLAVAGAITRARSVQK